MRPLTCCHPAATAQVVVAPPASCSLAPPQRCRRARATCRITVAAAAVQRPDGGQQQAPPPPADVVPHVLLCLEYDGALAAAAAAAAAHGSSSSADDASSHHDEQQQPGTALLVPRTRSRLRGMQQLPGFIPLGGQQPPADPQVTLWQQQAAAAWQAAAHWAATQQQQEQLQVLQQQQQQQPTHWAPLAAVIDAAGPQLQLQQLLQLVAAVHRLVQAPQPAPASSSSSSRGRGRQPRTESPHDSSSVFMPEALACVVQQPQADGGTRSGTVVLQCRQLLPRISSLVGAHLQPHQPATLNGVPDHQQQQLGQLDHPQPPLQHISASTSASSAALGSSAAVQLLQQLAALQSSGCLGAADAATVACIISQCVDMSTCSFAELSCLLLASAQLGHPLRSSWLQAYVDAVLRALAHPHLQQKQKHAGAGTAAAAAAAGGGGAATSAAFAGQVASTLDGLSRYPGPHAQPEQLTPLLAAVQPHLGVTPPDVLCTLATAAASLGLQPSGSWHDAAAAGAAARFSECSMRDLVRLLQGVTAGGHSPPEPWWQSWFEAAMMKCEQLLPADAKWLQGLQEPEQAAAAAAQEEAAGSSSSDEEAVAAGSAAESKGAPELPAALLCEALVVLLQQQRQAHPLWLAGMLEVHVRGRGMPELAACPQLLLLASQLLQDAPAFAVRYRSLLVRLLEPLQLHFNLLTPEQLAQAAEVCAVYQFGAGKEWVRWHGAAVLRIGRAFPLLALSRVRDAYRSQEVAAEPQLQQLLDTVPWRLQRMQDKEAAAARGAARRATITAKNEQRRRQNEADAAASQQQGCRGMGWQGPPGKGAWRQRKLKPPGTLERRF